MAEALDALVPVAIRVAVAGFTSSAWHIRNSSVMLYAAGEYTVQYDTALRFVLMHYDNHFVSPFFEPYRN